MSSSPSKRTIARTDVHKCSTNSWASGKSQILNNSIMKLNKPTLRVFAQSFMLVGQVVDLVEGGLAICVTGSRLSNKSIKPFPLPVNHKYRREDPHPLIRYLIRWPTPGEGKNHESRGSRGFFSA